MVTGVRLYTDGHKWFVQELFKGNIVGRFSSKKSAQEFICCNNLSFNH